MSGTNNHKIAKLEYDLGSAKRKATLRGARMQILMDHIKLIQQETDLIYPYEFDEWFNKDGVAK